jgi:hypothetical protein
VKHLGEKLHPDFTSNTLGGTAKEAKSEACEAFLSNSGIEDRVFHTHIAEEEAAVVEAAERRVCESKIPNENNMVENASHSSLCAQYPGEPVEKASPKLHQMLHQAFMGLSPKPLPALPPPSEEDCARLLDAIASACSISPQIAASAAWERVERRVRAGGGNERGRGHAADDQDEWLRRAGRDAALRAITLVLAGRNV